MLTLPAKYRFGYVDGDSTIIWDVRDIWETVKNTKVTHIPIELFLGAINEVKKEYNKSDILRVKKADLTYPIVVAKITDEDILVVDGFHRLNKYVDLKARMVPCKIIKEMPLPYFVKGEPFEIPGLVFKWKTKWSNVRKSQVL